MCAVAPFALPGLACVAPVPHAWSTAPTYAEGGAPAVMRGYGYDGDAADIDALLRDIHAAVHPRTPAASHTPQTVAAGADPYQPMSTAEFLALSRPEPDNHADFGLQAVLRGLPSIRIPAAGFTHHFHEASVEDTPTTPVASLPAPCSYGGDDDAVTGAAAAIQTSPKKQEEPSQPYDADIDATLRAMEKDPAERPSAHYIWTMQGGGLTNGRRAEAVAWMYNFAGHHGLAPGTLHRAVSYVDRFLSARRIDCNSDQLFLLAAVAVFTAAKYEDRRTTLALNADVIASHLWCTRRDAVNAERALFAALGYRLSGPTAYTFVEHFTRHTKEEGAGAAEGSTTMVMRSLAHHLTNMALLDYRCTQFLPSVVAASAIAVAKLNIIDAAASWGEEEMKVTGYKLEDLGGCMDAIKEIHGLQGQWPGVAQMIEDYCTLIR